MLTKTAIDKRIKKYAISAHEKCEDVPVNTHAHQFRHAKASHWLEDGINVVQASFLLRHENLETTMKYLDITTEDKVQAFCSVARDAYIGLVIPLALGPEKSSSTLPDRCNVGLDIIVDIDYNSNE